MRRWATILLTVLVAAVLLPLAGAPVAHADTDDAPLERFGACVRGGAQGSVLLLLDRSGSLKTTDPTNARVTSSKYLVNQLANSLGNVADANVQLAIAGFDTTFTRTLDWTDLDAANLGAIHADLDAYATRNDGLETDYWAAVDGARRELAARQTEAGGDCGLMVWFSDGGFALAERPDDAAVDNWGGLKPYAPDNRMGSAADAQAALEAGIADMCRPGGVADQLRSMDVVSLGIGLSVDAPPEAFDLMRGFTTAEGMDCGAITEPRPGEFLMAIDVDELLLAFDRVLSEGGDSVDTPVCVADECAEGTRTFVLDGSIGKVQGLASAPVDGTRILIRTRDGELVELTRDATSAEVPGAALEWEWLSERTLSVELDRDGQSEEWIGPWGLVFVAPDATDDVARSTLRLHGDLSAVWLNRDVELRSGAAPVELRFGLVDGEGNAVDPATLSDETFLSIAAVGAGGTVVTLADRVGSAQMIDPRELDPAGLPPGLGQLVLAMEITTRSWTGPDGAVVEGTRLEPIRTSVPLTILPPEDFPTIPARVSFGETEAADPVTITVPLEGDGCVWLGDDVRFTGYPTGLDSATLTSPATDAGSCSATGLELTLAPGDIGHGALVGAAQVFLNSPSSAEPVAVTLDFDLQMQRPASQPVLWGTLVGVTLLGIAIPLGILYLVKYLTSTIPGAAVLAGRASGPVERIAAQGINVPVQELAIAHLANNRRRVEVAGVTLVARMGLAPTEPGYVVVEQPGRAAGGRGALASKGERARLPLAVQGNWTVALDPNRPTGGDVTVTVFTGPGAPGLSELLDDVRTNIGDAVAKLREGLPPDATGPTTDPWGGGPAAPRHDPWANPPAAPAPNPWQTPPASQPPTQPPRGPRPPAPPSGGGGSAGW